MFKFENKISVERSSWSGVLKPPSFTGKRVDGNNDYTKKQVIGS